MFPVPTRDGKLTLDELFESYQQPLGRYALSLTQDALRADDLVQNTFIRALRHLDLLADLLPHQRRAWLYRTLKNLFLDDLRAARREQDYVEELKVEIRLAGEAFPNLRAKEVMEKLPENTRDLLHQHFILGMTSEEIGEKLGIPAATVRSRVHLAIKKLKKLEDD